MLVEFLMATLVNVVRYTWVSMANAIVQRYIIKMPLEKSLFKDKKGGK